MNRSLAVLLLLSATRMLAATSGPGDRLPTDPKSVVSAERAEAAPVKVADLLQTTRMGGATLSPDGSHIAYTGNASGRMNLWIMNIDGSGARQLLHSDDRQATLAFSHDGQQILYIQDKGGDEMYDMFALPVAGGEPRNLTNTGQTSETGPLFSRDGSMLAFDSKDKTSPSINIAVKSWPSGPTQLLTHETDRQASWRAVCWSSRWKRSVCQSPRRTQ